MEKYLYLKYNSNILTYLNEIPNIYEENKENNQNFSITNLLIYKGHLIYTISNNSILSVNTNKEASSQIVNYKCFSAEKGRIKKIKVNENRIAPLLFILIQNRIDVLDFKSFSLVKSYSFDVVLNDFTFFDDKNNYNLEIIYASSSNEIYYYSKGLLLDNKKLLTKEKDFICEIFYKEPYLIWSTSDSIKIFDLHRKILIYRKKYSSKGRIYFHFNDDFLFFIFNQRQVCVVNICKDKIFHDDSLVIGLSQCEDSHSECVFLIGGWVNKAKEKVVVLKEIVTNGTRQCFCEIYTFNKEKIYEMKLNYCINNTDYYMSIDYKPSLEYPEIENSHQFSTLNFSFETSSFQIFIYNNNDIYSLNLYDNKQYYLSKLKEISNETCNNENNINILKSSLDLYLEVNTYDEKYLIITKSILHMNCFISKSNLYKFQRNVIDFIEFPLKIRENERKETCLYQQMAIDDVCNLMIKKGVFDYCFDLLIQYFSYSSDYIKEKCIVYLLSSKLNKRLYEYIGFIKMITSISNSCIEFLLDSILIDSLYDKTSEFRTLLSFLFYVNDKYWFDLKNKYNPYNQYDSNTCSSQSLTEKINYTLNSYKILFSYMKNHDLTILMYILKGKYELFIENTFNSTRQIEENKENTQFESLTSLFSIPKQVVKEIIKYIKNNSIEYYIFNDVLFYILLFNTQSNEVLNLLIDNFSSPTLPSQNEERRKNEVNQENVQVNSKLVDWFFTNINKVYYLYEEMNDGTKKLDDSYLLHKILQQKSSLTSFHVSSIDISYLNSIYSNIIKTIFSSKNYFHLLKSFPDQILIYNILQICIYHIKDEDLLILIINNLSLDYDYYDKALKLPEISSSYENLYQIILSKQRKYKDILFLIINKQNNPEKAITFIESLDVDVKEKTELYKNLKEIIETSKSKELSSVKKFYFVSLFNKTSYKGLSEYDFSEFNREDVKYILLIIDQLKINKEIVISSLKITEDYVNRLIKLYLKEKATGSFFKIKYKSIYFKEDDDENHEKSQFSHNFLDGEKVVNKCCYLLCNEQGRFFFKEEIFIFGSCKHSYHKSCLEEYFYKSYSTEKNDSDVGLNDNNEIGSFNFKCILCSITQG